MIHYTSIEQSKKLLELGLKAETADACYDVGYGQTKAHIECENFISYFTNDEFPELKDRYIPCWSLGALLEVMPNGIQINANNICVSVDITFVRNGVIIGSHHVKNYTFLEAAFEMICWLLENDYIKKRRIEWNYNADTTEIKSVNIAME